MTVPGDDPRLSAVSADGAGDGSPEALVARVQRALNRIRFENQSRPVQATIVVLGLGFLIVGTVLSLTRLDLSAAEMRWDAIVAAAVLGLLLIPLNALEFAASGRLAGTQVAFGKAVEVTIVASAFNVLPVPAGIAVRIRGLYRSGTGTKTAVLATGLMGLTWLSWGLLVGSVALFVLDTVGFGLAFLAAGAVGLGVAWSLLRSKPGSERFRLLGEASILELAFLSLAAMRFYLVVVGIGVAVAPAQAVVLAVGSVLASTLGVIPGGLGVWEGISAALALLVSLPASAGFLAAAILRVMGLIQNSLAAVVLALVRSRSQG